MYPNLTRELIPKRIKQLWVADITYIRLTEEFVYLAVVLDAYSRLVIGWSLERTLEAKLAVNTLRVALNNREVPAGLIHHFDHGAQYACGDWAIPYPRPVCRFAPMPANELPSVRMA